MQSRLYDADLYSVQVTSLSWSSTLKKYVYTICIILIYCIFILKKNNDKSCDTIVASGI